MTHVLAYGKSPTAVRGYSCPWCWPEEGPTKQPLERGGRRRKGVGRFSHREALDAEQNLVRGATGCHLLFRFDWGTVSTSSAKLAMGFEGFGVQWKCFGPELRMQDIEGTQKGAVPLIQHST